MRVKCYSKLIGYTRGAVTIKGAVIYQSLRYNGSYLPREKIYPDCLRKAGTRFRSSRSNVQKAVVGLVARGA